MRRRSSNERRPRKLNGSLTEVDAPETDDEEELAFYRRYREIGGIAIEEFEDRLRRRNSGDGHRRDDIPPEPG